MWGEAFVEYLMDDCLEAGWIRHAEHDTKDTLSWICSTKHHGQRLIQVNQITGEVLMKPVEASGDQAHPPTA